MIGLLEDAKHNEQQFQEILQQQEAEYEQELPEPPDPWSDNGFEIIDFEQEAQILTLDEVRGDAIACH